MIKSLTFTGEFGYITDKIAEPICPVRGYNETNTPPWVTFTKEKKEQFDKFVETHFSSIMPEYID